MWQKDYQGLLEDKRWIKKRNKILKRDKYRCTVCGSNDNLQVHHTFYFENFTTPPWRYSDDSLLTLCDECHYQYHLTHENIVVPYNKNTKNKRSVNGYKHPKKKGDEADISLASIQLNSNLVKYRKKEGGVWLIKTKIR